MGWLSFLTKKSSPTDNPNDLKAYAYDETVAANPPIRGTYPVAGNGPNLLEKFQKSHPRLRDFHPDDDDSAPPPFVPRFLERPSTAPSHQSPEGSPRPGSQPETPSPLVREPLKKRYGPYKLPSKIAIDRNDDNANNKSIYSAPSLAFVRNRTSSILSADSGSTRRFVDLLDAQSFIRPSDFHGRVKAAGTKDYGEDVADRNIGENGFDLNSVPAREFYAKTSSLSIRTDNEDGRPSSPRKRHSMGSGLRTTSSNFDSPSAFPKKSSSQVPLQEHVDEKRARAVVRGNLERDLPEDLGSENRPPQSLRGTQEASAFDKDSIIDTLSHHTCNDSKQTLPDLEGQYRPARDSLWRKTASNVSLTTVKLPAKKDGLPSFQPTSYKEPLAKSSLPNTKESLREERGRDPSRRRRGSIADIHDPFYVLPPLQGAEPSYYKSSHHRPNSRDELSRHGRNRSTVSPSKRSIKRFEIEDPVPGPGSSIRRSSLTSETAGSTLSSNPFRPQSGHTTNTSIDLTTRVPLFKTIELSQASPIYSRGRTPLERKAEYRSDEFEYPQIDPEVLAEALVHSGRHAPSIDFSINEGVSSDDSFSAPRRPTGEFERDLLFQGYGLEGAQLPGLPGFFDAGLPKAKPTPSRRAQTFTAFKGPFHLAAFSSIPDNISSILDSKYSTRSLPRASRHRPSRLRIPTSRYTNSEDGGGLDSEDESEDGLNFDIPLTRPAASRHHPRGSRRQYGKAVRQVKEEDPEFGDVSRIARLRREAKSKQRTSSAPLHKAKGKEKTLQIAPYRDGWDDPSGYADVE
ncbi:hypothetical protein AAE478_002043 [Parahypoxylon ruwenzoriense]